MTVLVYEGFSLEYAPGGYQSLINRQVVKFDTVYMFKQYIDKFYGKKI
jgi:hypothetical protein